MNEILTTDEWQALLAGSEGTPFFILKHSTRCPISAAAYERVRAFIPTAPPATPPVFLVKVIESRPVSNAIAEDLQLIHKSPQMILVAGGKAAWSASHHGIHAESITEALKLLF